MTLSKEALDMKGLKNLVSVIKGSPVKKRVAGAMAVGSAGAAGVGSYFAGKSKGKKDLAKKFNKYNQVENRMIAQKAYQIGMQNKSAEYDDLIEEIALGKIANNHGPIFMNALLNDDGVEKIAFFRKWDLYDQAADSHTIINKKTKQKLTLPLVKNKKGKLNYPGDPSRKNFNSTMKKMIKNDNFSVENYKQMIGANKTASANTPVGNTGYDHDDFESIEKSASKTAIISSIKKYVKPKAKSMASYMKKKHPKAMGHLKRNKDVYTAGAAGAGGGAVIGAVGSNVLD